VWENLEHVNHEVYCFTDCAPGDRIGKAFHALCLLTWPNEIMDPVADMPVVKRKALASMLMQCVFRYRDVAIGFADHLDAFLFMDLTVEEREWKVICAHESKYI